MLNLSFYRIQTLVPKKHLNHNAIIARIAYIIAHCRCKTLNASRSINSSHSSIYISKQERKRERRTCAYLSKMRQAYNPRETSDQNYRLWLHLSGSSFLQLLKHRLDLEQFVKRIAAIIFSFSFFFNFLLFFSFHFFLIFSITTYLYLYRDFIAG